MRATVKRILAIILILTMVQFPGIRVEAEEITDNQNTGCIEETFINPLYDDIISEEDLVSADESSLIEAYAEEEYSTSIEECAAQLREGMKQRIESIKVYYQVPEYEGGYAKQLLDLAMMHTGNPSEGDYIKWQYGGCKASTSYFTDDTGMCCMTITFTCTYYTTGEQESVLDERINEVLAELNVYEADDYEKVRAIYDYVCTHVEYDYENDDDYKLKYTAYAALINGKAVCQGYALLFYRMTLELGVDNRLIPGTGNNGAHGWNIVKLGKYYYNADTTWDCNKEEYQYFLKCDENFSNHTRDEEYSTEEFYSVYPMAEGDFKRAEKIELDQSSCEIEAGDSVQLTAICDPESQSEIEWWSDNEEIASVDENGVVTGNAKGTAVITAYYGGREAKCNVKVTKTCPSTEHAYQAEWKWNEAEGEVPYKATLTLTCSKCEDQQTVDGEVKLTSQKAATCTEEGEDVYTATATYGGKEYTDTYKDTYEATGHTYADDAEHAVWTWSEDHKTASLILTCTVCGTATEAIQAKVAKKTTDATCTEDGEDVYTATATYEGKEYIDTRKDIHKAIGHTYADDAEHAAWTWSEDHKEASLVLKCITCGTPTEAITAKITEESTDATCTEAGTTTYKATAEYEGKTYTAEEIVTGEALGHDYKEGWKWNKVEGEDGKTSYTADLTLTCDRCGTVVTDLEPVVTVKSDVAATCTEDGETVYAATAEYEGKAYNSEKTVVNKATGHKFGEWEVETEPTESKEGLEIRTCEVCKAQEERTIGKKSNVSVLYKTHIQTYGTEPEWKSNGELSGTSREGKRLESIRIKLDNNGVYEGGIEYSTHVQREGWQDWKENGAMSGTEGSGLRLEAIKIRLTGDLAEHYDVYYAVHAQYYGWLNWAKNGEVAGTAGQSKRLEAIKIILVAKGGDAPEKIGTEDRCYVHYYVGYRTHVQTYGWQDYVYDGAMSGTSGESKRLEAINIKLMNQEYDGDIEYQTHVQTYGWEPKWSKNGALSGTSGEGKRLEAIRIRLTDEMAEKYDVYYRVHAQYYGWLGWAKNGEEAGTAGFGKRLEGIEIVLVEKDGKAPENSGEKKAFISQ